MLQTLRGNYSTAAFAFISEVYGQTKNAPQARRAMTICSLAGVHKNEALRIAYIGSALDYSPLAEQIRRWQITPETVYDLVVCARAFVALEKNPPTHGTVRIYQLKKLTDFMATTRRVHPRQLVLFFEKHIKEERSRIEQEKQRQDLENQRQREEIARKAAQAEKRNQERLRLLEEEERKATISAKPGATVDIPQIDHTGEQEKEEADGILPQIEETHTGHKPDMPSEPAINEADTESFIELERATRYNSKIVLGTDNNRLILDGLTDLELRAIVGVADINVDNEYRRLPKAQRRAISLINILCHSHTGLGQYHLNVVIDPSVAHSHPDFVFTVEGTPFTAAQVAEHAQKYAGSTSVVGLDDTGIARTVTKARFGGTVMRLFDQVEHVQCAFPGCRVRHNLHMHHVIPFAQVQETDRDNLVPLCERHHLKNVTHHEKNLTVFKHLGTAVWEDPYDHSLRIGVYITAQSAAARALGRMYKIPCDNYEGWLRLCEILTQQTRSLYEERKQKA